MVITGRIILLLMVIALSACFSSRVPPVHHGSHKVTVHAVHSGETLFSIGKRYGISYHTLAKRNGIRSPYRIFVGQRLYIYSRAPASSHHQVVREIRHVSSHKAKPHKSRVKKHRVPHRKSAQPGKIAASQQGLLRWPLKGVVTSRFGRRGSRMHDGIDIGVKEGTAIHASAGGEVVYSDSRLSGYGNLIIIRHSHNLFTAYAHNQRNLVRRGARVKSGDVIARVGHTGRATGPHLHYEVRQGSTPVDPLAYLPR